MDNRGYRYVGISVPDVHGNGQSCTRAPARRRPDSWSTAAAIRGQSHSAHLFQFLAGWWPVVVHPESTTDLTNRDFRPHELGSGD